jgi:peptidoglycan hydrolase-like protein with peptidoglycan-binding domain
VRYVKDSSIQCITAPCPTNEWKSEQVEFKTLKITGTSTSTSTPDRDNDHKDDNKQKKFKRDLWYRTRGDEVKTLQEILIKLGFLKGEATGFFGNDTFKAVKNYQRDVMHIAPTGKVGPMTRGAMHVED